MTSTSFRNFDAAGLAARLVEESPNKEARDAAPRRSNGITRRPTAYPCPAPPPQDSCIYCGATNVPLEDDGPDRRSCVDGDVCEMRLTERVTGVRPSSPLHTGEDLDERDRRTREVAGQLAISPHRDVPAAGPPSQRVGLATTYGVAGPIRLSDAVQLPIEAAVARYVVLGKSGAGKTNADYVLAEEFMRNGVPVIILDVLGNMHGLRSSADGNAPGFPIPIIGGRYGDIALSPWMAGELALIAGSGASSMIIDLSDFSREDQQLFAAEFFAEVIRHIETPVHFIVEEADTFAPKRFTSKAQYQSHTAISVFARYIRNHTGGWTFSTQRPPLLAHDIVDTASMFVAMKMTGEDSQEAIGAEVRTRAGRALQKVILEGVGQLKTGDAYLVPDTGWLGEDVDEDYPVRMHFRLRESFDASRRLKIGERREPPAVRAAVDLTPFAIFTKPRRAAVAIGTGDADGAPQDLNEADAGEGHAVSRRPASEADRDMRRVIIAELLRRLPLHTTPKPLLFALCDCDVRSFEDALAALQGERIVEVRRGRGGGVSITERAFAKLGIKSPKRSA